MAKLLFANMGRVLTSYRQLSYDHFVKLLFGRLFYNMYNTYVLFTTSSNSYSTNCQIGVCGKWVTSCCSVYQTAVLRPILLKCFFAIYFAIFLIT